MYRKAGCWAHECSLFGLFPFTLLTMNRLSSGAVGRKGWVDTQRQGRVAQPRHPESLTGPRRSMSSCLIWDTRASLATRARCRRSLNSISSPCISATWNTRDQTVRLRGQRLPRTLPPPLGPHLSARPQGSLGWRVNTGHLRATQSNRAEHIYLLG